MFSCIATPDPAFTVTGTVGATDCDQEKNFGSGCTVTGGEAGYALNALGGGVWVMAFEVRDGSFISDQVFLTVTDVQSTRILS